MKKLKILYMSNNLVKDWGKLKLALHWLFYLLFMENRPNREQDAKWGHFFKCIQGSSLSAECVKFTFKYLLKVIIIE